MENMKDRIFYHVYPLGFCGAPLRNDFLSPAGGGIRSLTEEIPRLKNLGIDALYLGPLFESTAHGYDTLDYYHVDRRLGNNGDLQYLSLALHDAGILLVLDGVLNHSGRHFFAFKDLAEKGPASAYRDWFANIDFNRQSPLRDPFAYDGWNGCYDLVKFNGRNRELREHLFGAVQFWIEEFHIDGLRLDAADQLLPDFMEELSRRCRNLKHDFWLMGEVVHGDYRRWVRPGCLHSVTNYELYKGLWSSFNDRNFFELSWTLNRQWGPEGLYRDLGLYNFADNHDVNRAASILQNKAHLFPLYGLLFTVPGIPSVYYGSEYGLRGERRAGNDQQLRPPGDVFLGKNAGTPPPEYAPPADGKAIFSAIRDFIRIRRNNAVLRRGSYRQIFVSHEQFAFMREFEVRPPEAPGGETGGETGGPGRILVAVNSSGNAVELSLAAETLGAGENRWRDLLSGEDFSISGGKLKLPLHPSWLRILQPEE
jgi:glycosidase